MRGAGAKESYYNGRRLRLGGFGMRLNDVFGNAFFPLTGSKVSKVGCRV